jgi:hypothetical protein
MQQVFQLKVRIRSTLTAICMVMSKIPMITMIGSSRSMLMQFKYFSKEQSRTYNLDTLVTLGTQDTGRRQTNTNT